MNVCLSKPTNGLLLYWNDFLCYKVEEETLLLIVFKWNTCVPQGINAKSFCIKVFYGVLNREQQIDKFNYSMNEYLFSIMVY